MTRRKLSEEEVALWRQVAQTAERLHVKAKQPTEAKPNPNRSKQPQFDVPTFQIGTKALTRLPSHDLMPSIAERVARQPVQMDKKVFGRLKRGKLMPEGKIDLHGLTVDQAHGALTGFLMRAHGDGKRLVLVVTGKGKNKHGDDGPIPTRLGVLKHQVPQWLSLPPLKSCVLQISEAHVRHGGGGAYYVYLRRR